MNNPTASNEALEDALRERAKGCVKLKKEFWIVDDYTLYEIRWCECWFGFDGVHYIGTPTKSNGSDSPRAAWVAHHWEDGVDRQHSLPEERLIDWIEKAEWLSN